MIFYLLSLFLHVHVRFVEIFESVLVLQTHSFFVWNSLNDDISWLAHIRFGSEIIYPLRDFIWLRGDEQSNELIISDVALYFSDFFLKFFKRLSWC